MTEQVVLLVIGTSGMVLPLSQITAMYPGFKILNNLAPESAIDDTHFNRVLHMRATEADKGIDLILDQCLTSPMISSRFRREEMKDQPS